jgi:hypothetical protein
LIRGEGKLDYDVLAFRLTPDGFPRLFVRARWKLVNASVFLMSAWFKAESLAAVTESAEAKTLRVESSKAVALQRNGQRAEVLPVLLSADSSWSSMLREGTATGALGDSLDFQTILNEFDADHDGWAELLIHSDQGPATVITLYLYSDLGLAPLKTPLRRESQAPESCVDP